MRNALFELGLRPPYPICLSSLETLKNIHDHRLSIARFGDGEFNLIFGGCCIFQSYDPYLQRELKEVLVTDLDNLLIGIPDIFSSLREYSKASRRYWRKYLLINRSRIYEILNFDKMYVNSMISRPYIKSRHSDAYVIEIIKKWKQIWQDRSIVIVKGSTNKFSYNSDLFNNVYNQKVVITPSENAFSEISSIIEKITHYSKSSLILLSIGPTATVLASRLTKLGYQALDIGHLERAYMTFLSDRNRNIA